jgi:hypothetical protein
MSATLRTNFSMLVMNKWAKAEDTWYDALQCGMFAWNRVIDRLLCATSTARWRFHMLRLVCAQQRSQMDTQDLISFCLFVVILLGSAFVMTRPRRLGRQTRNHRWTTHVMSLDTGHFPTRSDHALDFRLTQAFGPCACDHLWRWNYWRNVRTH